MVVKFVSNIFSEKNTVQDTALVISKDDKFEELNEKKKEKRQRDENNEKERDSCVSFFFLLPLFNFLFLLTLYWFRLRYLKIIQWKIQLAAIQLLTIINFSHR